MVGRSSKRVVLVVCLLVAWAGTAGAQSGAAPGRIVAVGDIHGDLNGLVSILQQAKLLDASRQWIGGKATLVQTGDTIDRGPEMRGVLDLLMTLEKRALARGGRVIVLLGNHEVMNLMGDLRYVAPENYASFANKDSEKQRKKAWEEFRKWHKSRAEALEQSPPVFTPQAEQEWMEAHPPGFFEHRLAFGPTGTYGKWLRQRQAVALVGGTVFMHGGLTPALANWTVEALNKRIADELASFDNTRTYLLQHQLILPFFTLPEIVTSVQREVNFRKARIAQKEAQSAQAGKKYEVPAADREYLDILQDFLGMGGWLSIAQDGPLWFRGYADWSDEEGEGKIASLLQGLGATRIVVGHTPQEDGSMRVRFGGKVILIDTGMLASYYKGGRASALEMDGAKFTAIYPDQRVVLLDTGTTAVPGNSNHPETDALEPEDEPGGGLPQGPAGSTQKPKASTPEKQNASAETQSVKAAPLPAAEYPSSPPTAPPARTWFGPDGKPLPFQSDEEALEFLRTAQVVSAKTIGEGITRPQKVLLRKDGIEMHAIFRDVDQERDVATLATGRREMFFRDSYIFELAAYHLALLLGLDNVPPTIERRLNGVKGSFQLWIEKGMSETRRQREKIRPPNVIQWNYQVQTLRLFDNLVYNTDRNMGNLVIDPRWKLWMIDHTRAFRRHSTLKNAGEVVICERSLWHALQTVEDSVIAERLKPYLRKYEIEGLLARRKKLVEHLRQLIAERGEDKVLFGWDPVPGGNP
jgi:hypothetical protein